MISYRHVSDADSLRYVSCRAGLRQANLRRLLCEGCRRCGRGYQERNNKQRKAFSGNHFLKLLTALECDAHYSAAQSEKTVPEPEFTTFYKSLGVRCWERGRPRPH